MNWRQDAAEAYRAEPGSVLAGRYRIVGAIGQGGMGSVYLAEDVRLGGKLRAVKLTKPTPDERDAFIAEARMLGKLQHPHLPQIVDYYPPDADGTAAIVMDYIAGETLGSRWMQLGFRMPFAMLLRYMLHLCDALRYLHAQEPPIVFRDLKPGNVLIDERDRAVLVDFGIARLYKDGAASDTARLGTPGFAAPEQLRGEQSDARTDLYGLGALAYYLLSGGSFAYRRGGRAVKLDRSMPPAFEELLERLLADRPEDRPASAALLYRELSAFAAPLSPPDSRSAWFGGGEGAVPAEHERERPSVRLSPLGPDADAPSGSGPAAIVAFVSAYPGAGATFAAVAFSHRLAALEAPHALVECPGGEGELYALLDGGRRKPARAAFADPSGERPAAPAWRSGTAAYYALDPASPAQRHSPERAFADWLRRLGPRLVLLDVSSRWETPGVADWLAHCADRLLFVADCLPAKWNERRQRAVRRLAEEAARRGAGIGWIANRDQAFPERDEWLGAFPDKPAFHMPICAAPAVVRALWRGEPLAIEGELAVRMDRFIAREWVPLTRG